MEQRQQHTPGPWTGGEWKFPSIFGNPDTYPYYIEGADGFRVASIINDGTDNAGTAEANARLIAAAPDLLAALEAWVNLPASAFVTAIAEAQDDMNARRSAAVAAIRRARGED